MARKIEHKKTPAVAEIECPELPEPAESQRPERDHNEGRALYKRALQRFTQLESDKKHEQLKEAWKEVAMGAALRAKAFVATCSPKDFGRLYQVIMSGAVSIDKAFPPKERSDAPAFVLNLFGSLGQRASSIAQPTTPPKVIDVPVKEVPWQDSSSTTTCLSPMSAETSPTKTLDVPA